MTGIEASVSFHRPGKLPGQRMDILHADEGRYENGTWKFLRIWNGDQTDRGLNFKHEGSVIHIHLDTF